MAEATDRPQGAGEVSSTTVTPKAEIGAMPAMSEPYRPLSLLALAGFGVAVLYAFVVVLGGVVALINRVPWLMPAWTFFIPVAALVVCWAARTRIRDSEETLSGLAFTTWGSRLAIVVGLTYAAYYGFTFFAVRLQALACAEQFFVELKNNRPDRAFLLAMGAPLKGVEESELRDQLENLHNAPQGPNGGNYSRFHHSSLVRAIETANGKAEIKPVGVTEWEYKDGYRVVLKYHIATPLSEFDMNVETFGRDSKPGEPRGRQWQVDLQKGQTSIVSSTLKLTPRGEDLRQAAQMAWSFASSWQDKINQQKWDEVYLDTRPPAERDQLRKQQPAGWQKLAESDLIRIDDKTFWTGKAQRDDILRHIRNTFRSGKRTFALRLQQAEMPLIHASDGRVTARIDAQLTYLDLDANGEKPKYVVEGQLVVSAAEDEAQRTPSVWRVEAIEPESGRTPPERPPGPGGPGGP
ncbi:MAG TPA: hypothetical protein VH575_31725 [Gemmataceae bacterium]